MNQIHITESLDNRPLNELPVIWKILHVAGYALSCIFGFFAFIFLRKVYLLFENECILYSDLEIEYLSPTNWTVLIENSSWGRKYYCEIPQIISLFSFIYGTILLLFFLMSGSGSGGIQNKLCKPMNLVMPALIFCFTFTCVSIYCCVHAEFGYHVFCENLKKNAMNINENEDILEYFHLRCGYSENLFIGQKPVGLHMYFLDLACFLMLLQCITWAYNTMLLLMRCCCVVDFKLIMVVSANYAIGSNYDIKFVDNLTRLFAPKAVEGGKANDDESFDEALNDLAHSIRKSIMEQMTANQNGDKSSKVNIKSSHKNETENENRTSDSQQSTSNSPQSTSNSQQSTSNSQESTSNSQQSPSNNQRTKSDKRVNINTLLKL